MGLLDAPAYPRPSGITLENAGIYRDQVTMRAYPRVLSNPPQITYDQFQSSISNSTLIPWTDTRFRSSGSVPQNANSLGGYPAGTNFGVPIKYQQSTADTFGGSQAIRWDFKLKSANGIFGFYTRTNSATWRLWINGQVAWDLPVPVTVAGGNNNRFVLVNLGGAFNGEIGIEGETIFMFGGVLIPTTDAVAPPDSILSGSIYFSTDSFGAAGVPGQPAGAVSQSHVNRTCHLLGLGNYDTTSCCGTTGLYNPGTSPRLNYVDRFTTDLGSKAAPDIYFIQGSINDLTATPTQVATQLTTLIGKARAIWPETWIVVQGICEMKTQTATAVAINNAMQAVATGYKIRWISTVGWITGSGNVAAPAGDGNADQFCDTDGMHPSPAGQIYLAGQSFAQMNDLSTRERARAAANQVQSKTLFDQTDTLFESIDNGRGKSLVSGGATSGTLFLSAGRGCKLTAGVPVSGIRIWNGTVAGAGLTHSFAALVDFQTLNVLAVTTDDTTATLAANASKTWTFASPYVPPASREVFVAICFVGTTMPSPIGISHSVNGLLGATPRLSGPSSTGLSSASSLTVGSPVTAPSASGSVVYCQVLR